MIAQKSVRLKGWQNQEIGVSEADLLASICRESFFEFVKEFWEVITPEPMVLNWHIEYLCTQLQNLAERVFEGKSKKHDLIVNIPPGTTKSTLCSVMFPVWVWTRMPTAQTIGASFSADLANDLAGKSRDIVWSDKFRMCWPDIELRPDMNSKKFFKNTIGGWRKAIGVGGMITGFHGHFIIIDDPLDPNAALSEADLKSINTWMSETIPKRKVDKAVTPTILIMQRLHEDDPTGNWLERTKGKGIKLVKLPAELTDDVQPKYLRRKYKDKLLDPKRLPTQVLEEAQMEGQYSYAGQYLQDPAPPGGGMFQIDRLVIDKEPPHPKSLVRVVRYWDKAASEGKGSAYTTGVKMAKDQDGEIYVLDVVRGQWESYQREKMIRQTAELDGPGVAIKVEQEPGSGGKDSARTTAKNLAGFKVKIDPVGQSQGNKIQRADPFSSAVNAGYVHLVKRGWNVDYINELRLFPEGRNKDQVDASSGAYNELVLKRKIGGLNLFR